MTVTLSNFIYYIWPWIGLGGAISIVILLFCTDFLRVDMTKSRWKDPAWLGASNIHMDMLSSYDRMELDFIFSAIISLAGKENNLSDLEKFI